MTSSDTTLDQRLHSPVVLIVGGVLLAALGVAGSFIDLAPAPFVLACWIAAAGGGLLAQVGVVAAGVEYGLRRVRES